MEHKKPQPDEAKSMSLEAATSDELKFARLVAEYGKITVAATKMWPDVSQNEEKAHRWLKRPVVRAAVASAKASRAAEDPAQIRLWFEMCGLGLQERIKIVSDLIRDEKTSRNAKLELLRYIDELEGRAKKPENDMWKGGLLEAFVLGGMSQVAGSVQKALPPVQDAEEVEEVCPDGSESAN